MHDHSPFPFATLPDQPHTAFNAKEYLVDAVNVNCMRKATLKECFQQPHNHVRAGNDILGLFVPICVDNKELTLRKRGMCIARVYFRRILLMTVREITSFMNLRTYNDVEHETFMVTYVARKLHENDEK